MTNFHLLHILRNAWPDFAGIAGLAAEMTKTLGAHQSMLFLSEPGPLSQKGFFGAIEPFAIPWRNSKDIAGDRAIFALLGRIKPDLIHQHSGGWPIRLIARAACSAPIILHLHGRDVEGAKTPRRLVQPTWFSDAVIAVSQAIADDSRDPRCTVVPNGVVLPEDVPHQPEPNLIVTAGRLVPVRGFDILIEAMTLLPGLRLDLAGAGSERENLHRRVQQLGLAERVRFLGWCDDLLPLLRRGAIYVSPAREDGFGLALAEAMAAGLPVVATDVGGVSALVGDAGILVPAERPDALARAIQQLMSDGQARTELGAKARARVARDFSISRMQAGVFDAYRRCFEARGRALPESLLHG